MPSIPEDLYLHQNFYVMYCKSNTLYFESMGVKTWCHVLLSKLHLSSRNYSLKYIHACFEKHIQQTKAITPLEGLLLPFVNSKIEKYNKTHSAHTISLLERAIHHKVDVQDQSWIKSATLALHHFQSASSMPGETQGYNSLTYACSQGSGGAISYMVHLFPELMAQKDERNKRPIEYLIDRKDMRLFEAIVQAHPELLDRSALTYAFEYASPEMIETIVRVAPHLLNQYNASHKTPLEYVIHRGQVKCFQILISLVKRPFTAQEKQALLGILDKDNLPMIEAIRRHTPSFLQAFQHAIDTADKDKIYQLISLYSQYRHTHPIHGWSPLVYACRKSSLDIIDTLATSWPALLNYETSNEETPIGTAIVHGNLECVKRLVVLGADPNLVFTNGYTPLSLAMAYDQPNIEKWLIDHGAHEKRAKETIALKSAANILGIGGQQTVTLPSYPSFTLPLDGIHTRMASHLLIDTLHNFFASRLFQGPKDLSLQEQQDISQAIDQMRLLHEVDTATLIQKIGARIPFVAMHIVENHAIALIFYQNSLIVCNRGQGREEFAIQPYCLPPTTTEAFLKSIKTAPTMESFNLLLKQVVRQPTIPEYAQKDQPMGNCPWANAKCALLAVALCLVSDKAKAKAFYKKFSTFTRSEAVKAYLTSSPVPQKDFCQKMMKKLERKLTCTQNPPSENRRFSSFHRNESIPFFRRSFVSRYHTFGSITS